MPVGMRLPGHANAVQLLIDHGGCGEEPWHRWSWRTVNAAMGAAMPAVVRQAAIRVDWPFPLPCRTEQFSLNDFPGPFPVVVHPFGRQPVVRCGILDRERLCFLPCPASVLGDNVLANAVVWCAHHRRPMLPPPPELPLKCRPNHLVGSLPLPCLLLHTHPLFVLPLLGEVLSLEKMTGRSPSAAAPIGLSSTNLVARTAAWLLSLPGAVVMCGCRRPPPNPWQRLPSPWHGSGVALAGVSSTTSTASPPPRTSTSACCCRTEGSTYRAPRWMLRRPSVAMQRRHFTTPMDSRPWSGVPRTGGRSRNVKSLLPDDSLAGDGTIQRHLGQDAV